MLFVMAPIFLLVAQWRGACDLAENHEKSTARHMMAMMAPLLQRAHLVSDDLQIQQTIQAVSMAPGVTFALMVDPQNRITAHSEPLQLGRTLHLRPYPGLWIHTLTEGKSEWGKFAFELSDSGFRRMALKKAVLQAVCAGFAFLFAPALLYIHEKQEKALKMQLADLSTLLVEEKSRLLRQDVKMQENQNQGQAWMVSAISRFPEAAIFLDSQQRIFALNPAALRLLNEVDVKSLLGKSWHEIQLLGACGKELEKSLASPGVPVQWSNAEGDLRLRFETDKDGLSGTWIFVNSPSLAPPACDQRVC
jgi:PAS domain-containing protein